MIEYNEQQKNCIASCRDFARKYVAPVVYEADEKEEFSITLFREMGRYGLFGTLYPESYGGANMGSLMHTRLVREVAKTCAATAMTIVSHANLACYPIFAYGNDHIKEKLLRLLISGDKIGAFALTEPGSGSDIASLQTSAKECENSYILNGSKTFITNANVADIAVVAAKTSSRAGILGISLFVVEKGTPGFSTSGRHERKLGMRSSDTGEFVFCNAAVPKINLLGEKNKGFDILQRTLTGARLDMAAIALGIAEGARNLCLDYVGQRKQFNKYLYQFELIKCMLANMETRISAAELLVEKAAWMKDQGKSIVKEASEAKLFASETAVVVTKDAVQIHGAYGYSRELPLERYYRDAKLTEIGDGTSEIQRLIIADEMVKNRTFRRR